MKAFVAPNPAKGTARLILSAFSNVPVQLLVVDVLGRRYKAIKFSAVSSKTIDIAVNDLRPGNYFILLKQGSESTQVKMIVEK